MLRLIACRPLFRYSRIIPLTKFYSSAKVSDYETIPGGGLGKLQGVKEEEYFCKEQQKLLKKMKVIKEITLKPDTDTPVDEANITKIEELENLEDGNYNCNHESCNHLKNVREEMYFYKEQKDSLQALEKNHNIFKKTG